MQIGAICWNKTMPFLNRIKEPIKIQKSENNKLLTQKCEALTYGEPRAKPWEQGPPQKFSPERATLMEF